MLAALRQALEIVNRYSARLAKSRLVCFFIIIIEKKLLQIRINPNVTVTWTNTQQKRVIFSNPDYAIRILMKQVFCLAWPR